MNRKKSTFAGIFDDIMIVSGAVCVSFGLFRIDENYGIIAIGAFILAFGAVRVRMNL